MGDVYMLNGKILSGLPNHAKDIIFDNTGTTFSSTNTEDAIKEVNSNLTDGWIALNTNIDYCVRGNVVYVKIKNSTQGTLGTLPAGLAPDIDCYFSIYEGTNTANSYGLINTSGVVIISSSTVGWLTTIVSYPKTI